MTDAERLDWMIAHHATVYYQDGGPHWVVVTEKGVKVRKGVLRDDLRAAIDAADAENKGGTIR